MKHDFYPEIMGWSFSHGIYLVRKDQPRKEVRGGDQRQPRGHTQNLRAAMEHEIVPQSG